MKIFKDYKIELLSVTALVLACFLVMPSRSDTVYIYLDGNNKDIASIVDLKIDYDKSDLSLKSFNSYGILKHWNNDRFLIMPDNSKLERPIIALYFNRKNVFARLKINILDKSQIYLSHIGVSDLRNSEIKFIVNYDH